MHKENSKHGKAPTGQKIKTKTIKASLPKVPTPPREEESEEEEEEVTTHLRGEDPLTSHFTIPTSDWTRTTDSSN